MKSVFDNGDVFDDEVGIEFKKSLFHKATAISVDRSEIIFFTAKGGLWNNYVYYLRNYILINDQQLVHIEEDK